MTVCICVVWVVLIVLTGVAFWKGKIFISKEEDVMKDSLLGEDAEQPSREQTPDLEKGHGDNFAFGPPQTHH
jgi:hypothetical protein